jgi:hypothetical protein
MRAVPGVDSTGPIDHMHLMAQSILGVDDDMHSPPQSEPPPRADAATSAHSEGLELSELFAQEGIHDFPPPDVCEEFFRAFLRYIYPCVPCLDVAYLHELRQQSSGSVQSPLVLWATLLATCPYVEVDIVKAMGYRSRRDAQENMLKKAKVTSFPDVYARLTGSLVCLQNRHGDRPLCADTVAAFDLPLAGGTRKLVPLAWSCCLSG